MFIVFESLEIAGVKGAFVIGELVAIKEVEERSVLDKAKGMS